MCIRDRYYGIENNEMGEPIEGETHIHIAKNRSGSTATIKLQFIKEYQKFVDLPDTSFGNFKPLGDNPQAVSYTHLDVYKRQPLSQWKLIWRKAHQYSGFWANIVVTNYKKSSLKK